MRAIATLNVIDGWMTVAVDDQEDVDLIVVDGEVSPAAWDLDPWGAEEYDLDRADAALAGEGWLRAGPWDRSVETAYRAPVTTASQEAPLWFAVLASCRYRDEVRRYDVQATSAAQARAEAAWRYGHEPPLGVDVGDVTVEIVGVSTSQDGGPS